MIMEELMSNVKYDAAKVISEAVGHNQQFCTPSHVGAYITTLKLSVDTVPAKEMDAITEVIVATNRCERNDAYMGQVNLFPHARFCGLEGAVWGLDLAKSDEPEEPLYMQAMPDGTEIPVVNIKPLLHATERLFGQYNQQRFPILPGANVLGSGRKAIAKGPTWTWAVIGVGIPANRDFGACFLVEDASAHGDYNTTEGEIIGYLKGIQRKVTNGIALSAKDLDVALGKIYIGFKYVFTEPDQLGCAMACTPFVRLAEGAIPQGAQAADLQSLSISQWEQVLDLPELTIDD